MNKRVITITQPYHMRVKNKQLVLTEKTEEGKDHTIPVEDLGCVIFESDQITVTIRLLQEFAENNVGVIFCNKQYMPASMLFHLDTHYVQQEKFSHQIEASQPLKKRLWQQTIQAKIWNQALLLEKTGKDGTALKNMARQVKSGDSEGKESKAARYYWGRLFDFDFKRLRDGEWPNALLNYGYSILRGMTARALSGAGLLPTLGIHHHNKYNAYCLADDIMEPYRPFVDQLTFEIIMNDEEKEITTDIKKQMLEIIQVNTLYAEQVSPIQVALQKTAQSLANSFLEKKSVIKYAKLI